MAEKRTLRDVKRQLAEKYEQLAAIAGSKPKRKQFSFRARTYRRQLEQMSQTSEAKGGS